MAANRRAWLRAVAGAGLASRAARGRVVEAGFPPPDAEGGWPIAEGAAVVRERAGMDVGGLDRAFDVARSSTENGGLLVVRRGVLAYERYFGRGHREAVPNLASCGKSVTSLAVGMVMGERPELFPDGLDQAVFTPSLLPAEAFPLADPALAGIRLGHLLTFTAGMRGNSPGRVRGRDVAIEPAGPDGASAMYDDVAMGRRGGVVPLWCGPGEGYSYATAAAHLASVIVRHVSGQELEAFVRERLAGPLGWGRWGYGYRQGPGRRHTPGGGGIALRATDMARLGYLLLRGGRWGERPVVPASYVTACGRPSPFNPHAPYSLQFDVNADGHVAGVPRDAFGKAGSGGHALWVVPSLDLVVWKLGGRDGQYDPADTGMATDPAAAEAARVQARGRVGMSAEAGIEGVVRGVVEAVV